MINNNRKYFNLIVFSVSLAGVHGCAVLTPSQVSAVGDFAIAAENYSDLPGAVIDTHTQTMFAENIYASASLNDPDAASGKLNRAVESYLSSLKTAEQADLALGVIDNYVKLLKKLTSADFTQQLEQETTRLASEIDAGIEQYNHQTEGSLQGFGASVAEGVRAGGGIIIRYKQAQALKNAVNGAEPVMQRMSAAVTELMDLYICGALDAQGICALGSDNKPFPGFGQLAEEGLVNEYQIFLKSGKGSNSVKEAQVFTTLLLKAKSIKPLAEKTRQAILSFQAAHTALYKKLQESMTLEASIEEINTLYEEVKSAQRYKNTIASPNNAG